MQLPVTCQTLGALDHGAAGAIIDAAIREAVRDLDDRGEDGKPRKVSITLTLEKLENGLVACHVEAAAKVPLRKTASHFGAIRADVSGDPQVLVQTGAPDDPHQRTLDEFARRREEVADA